MNIHNLIKETVKEVLLEDFHHRHKDYRLYEGSKHITAIFEDNSRLTFEVHFRNTHGEDRLKHREKACSKWKSLASKIHGNVGLNEVGNEIKKSWKESFRLALEDKEMQTYIRRNSNIPVFQ